MPDRDKPERPTSGGYAERGPGRGEYPRRGDKADKEPLANEPVAEEEASERSRWRDAEADERSDRWDDKADDALDPEIPDAGNDDGSGGTGQDAKD